jgi:CBS domain-containing protein
MRVNEVMTTNPVCAAAETPLARIALLMAENRCGAIPIVDDGRVVGIITDRDITCRVVARGRNPLELTARDAMTYRVKTVRPDDRAETAERIIKHGHVRRLPVTDADGRLVGIVSVTDLERAVEELASGAMFPKVAHHVPKKTSPRFLTWM